MALRLPLLILAICLVVTSCSPRDLKTRILSRSAKPAHVEQPIVMEPAPEQRRSLFRRVSHRRNQPATQYAEKPYVLDSGDRVRIAVFGQDNLTRVYAVDGGGFVSMPLIGAVRARGSTTFDLESTIAAKLRAKYIKDPKVTVEIETYRPFFVLGEVRSPGQFPYVNNMTVQAAIAIAGGYSERARERSVQLTRRVDGVAKVFTVPSSYPVRPGDTIYVRERFF